MCDECRSKIGNKANRLHFHSTQCVFTTMNSAVTKTTATCPHTFAHLPPRLGKDKAPVDPPTVHKETTAPVVRKQVPLQKELMVNTFTDDVPKTPALTNCNNPLIPVQIFKTYFRVESQWYQDGQRLPPPRFRATIN